jgi:hypothetical protein
MPSRSRRNTSSARARRTSRSPRSPSGNGAAAVTIGYATPPATICEWQWGDDEVSVGQHPHQGIAFQPARSLGLGERAQAWAIVLAGLATPVWFYAVMFWEHSLAVCLVVWSLVAIAGFARTGSARSLALGAIAGAFAVYFRDDLYVALPLLAGFALPARPSSRRERLRALTVFAGAAILALCPLWACRAGRSRTKTGPPRIVTGLVAPFVLARRSDCG